MSDTLTEAQIRYAAADVRYLIPLYDALDANLHSMQLDDLASRCFEHLPVRVRLEVLGYDDVYGYVSTAKRRSSFLQSALRVLRLR